MHLEAGQGLSSLRQRSWFGLQTIWAVYCLFPVMGFPPSHSHQSHPMNVRGTLLSRCRARLWLCACSNHIACICPVEELHSKSSLTLWFWSDLEPRHLDFLMVTTVPGKLSPPYSGWSRLRVVQSSRTNDPQHGSLGSPGMPYSDRLAGANKHSATW